ncbi:MAG: ABC transporter ATP-binding protein [Oscillospiraceae bacterium]
MTVSNRQIVKRLLSYTGSQKTDFVLIMLLAAAGNILSLTAPFFIGKAIDAIVGAGEVDFARVAKYALILIPVYVISGLLTYLCAVLASKSAAKTVLQMRTDAFSNMIRLKLSYLDTHSNGDIQSKITNDCDAVCEGLTQLFTQFFSGIVTVCAALGFMLWLSPVITLAVIVVTPLIFIVAKTVTKMSGSQFKKQQAIIGELGGYVSEQLSAQKTVKAFAHEQRSAEEFKEINARLYEAGQKAQFYSSLTNPSTRFVNYVAYVAVGLVGGIVSVNQGLGAGIIASFISYTNMFSKPFNEFTAITTQLLSATAAAGRIFALIDEEREPADSDGAKELTDIKGEVVFDRVSFSYLPDKPLITDFSLSVPSGSMVAVVGPTGAGKTTLINLLMRFYEVNSGSIRIDGEDISSYTKSSLRKGFGMVLQETWLFNRSVRDNIRYGKPDATDEEVIRAAKTANAHGFIKSLPNGYDTIIKQDASNLSQGQKQLIAIARITLLSPPMLILDEATSNVDTLTEQKIQRAFMQMMKGKTSFVIAHRLSTIKESDLIIVMNNGSVVETGSHKQLLKKGGFYSKLYNLGKISPSL